jgi:hypothetical protein
LIKKIKEERRPLIFAKSTRQIDHIKLSNNYHKMQRLKETVDLSKIAIPHDFDSDQIPTKGQDLKFQDVHSPEGAEYVVRKHTHELQEG